MEVFRRWIENYLAASDVLARNRARQEGRLVGEMEIPPFKGLGKWEAGKDGIKLKVRRRVRICRRE